MCNGGDSAVSSAKNPCSAEKQKDPSAWTPVTTCIVRSPLQPEWRKHRQRNIQAPVNISGMNARSPQLPGSGKYTQNAPYAQVFRNKFKASDYGP